MKSLLLSAILITAAFSSLAQNWLCVSPGVKQYFINGVNYLRGIRIDSVKTINGNTVLYPFACERGGALGGNTKNGSWLGHTITVLPDGTHYFDNYWGDTVILKPQAQLNDSWVMYNDASDIYYTATITSVATDYVLGNPDSVKTITIKAYQQSTPLTTDPMNNSQLVISKDNGFVQTCDLYMFPLSKKDGNGSPTYQFDYPTMASLGMQFSISQFTSLFHIVTLVNADSNDFYNYAPGDVLEWKLNDNKSFSLISTSVVLEKINSKNQISANHVEYSGKKWEARELHPQGMSAQFDTTIQNFTDIYAFGNGPIVDTVRMPEEVGQLYLYTYAPNDSSYCHASTLYGISTYERIRTLAHCIFDCRLKKDVGLVSYYYCTSVSNDLPFGYSGDLTYIETSGIKCGNLIDLGVHDVNKDSWVLLSPNPASSELQIAFPRNDTYHVSVINSMGVLIKLLNITANKALLNIAGMPDGIYILSVQSKNGDITHQQFVVSH